VGVRPGEDAHAPELQQRIPRSAAGEREGIQHALDRHRVVHVERAARLVDRLPEKRQQLLRLDLGSVGGLGQPFAECHAGHGGAHSRHFGLPQIVPGLQGLAFPRLETGLAEQGR
jgi:hypothetical protein